MPPSSEQYAQLAALFTTSAEPNDRARIELLLPAHLPVQGGLWLVPYAGREAVDGLSMLVRMHEDSIDLAAIGEGQFDFSSCNSLEEIVQCIEVPIAHWIVQPPSNADPTSLLHCDADRVTLLSGADQAAVVGAYRLLKGLIAAMGETEALPPLRLVVVGAEERTSSDAASRIVQTAHHQLGVQIEVGQPLPAMRSTNNVVSQVTIPRLQNVVDLMASLRQEAQQEKQEADALPTSHRFEIANEEPEVISTAEPKPVVEIVESEVHEEQAEVVDARLSSYVDGLLAITPRCPEHEHIELAVDAAGQVHILANADDLRDAAIVSGWVVKHHDLLALACGGIQLDGSLAPVQHLFTDQAVAVADLHLLTDIEVEGNVGVFSTPLN